MIFSLPFIVAVAIELFILPIDYFTFRVWESLIVKKTFGILRGPFYPNMVVRKMEEGELAYYTSCAIKKDVTWVTDKYGYRRKNTPGFRYPIVIIGDSNIAGSGLTQDDILSEVLHERLDIDVYPLSPERINSIFYHRLFSRNAPEVVIFACIERAIPSWFPRLDKKGFNRTSYLTDSLSKSQLYKPIENFAVLLDRTFKANMLNYLRARINKSGPSLPHGIGSSNCQLLYSRSHSSDQQATDERYKQSLAKLKEYSDFFKQKGMRFIFIPIPNKNSVYLGQHNKKKPEFLSNLIQGLRKLEVEVIDTDKAFHDFYQKTGTPIYQEDDTHWNALGVKIAAELIIKQLKEQPVPNFR